ncbi:DNA polymerase III subunit delta' [Methylomonas sp. LW13]|uniref:DNA polymerase III subunit delta' n=1 Tax=unclassified Methylomonas TaxID=2608980 RepID=UPI00051BDCA5|nr:MULTISPECIES: DNA polymerase III subunit delta' [unclassified Methylomonas]PKD41698.1 DNA polymerase III subunit delta' [Methylomonas sp. Kb3]QBC26326.1 DNA polymerase III subunit delta' [Methylomonas sp. LW13]
MSTQMQVYPWQQDNWRQLHGYIEQQRIPQALLFSGAAGQGKRHLAGYYARTLLCHAPLADASACGHCIACKLFDAQTHPDFLTIEPDEPGKAIGIDKIRQLIVKLALKPQYDHAYRVVIIQPADALNTASANAFLKCLEEPTERTCLLLISEQPSRLPATIRSRCQKIDCVTPAHELAMTWLRQQRSVGEQADLLLTLAQGSPLLAQQYAELNMIQLRQQYFDAWLQVAQGKENLLTVAEFWQKQEKIDLAVVLRWMASWVADIVKCAYRAESLELANPDLKNALQALAQRLELKRLYRFYDNVLTTKSQLNTQLNKQLMVEQLLISWSQLNRH